MMLLILVGCGGGTPVPQAGTPAANTTSLAGRLLFVRAGVIWQWRGSAAQALLGDGNAWQPALAPDGRRIAYVRRDNSFSDVLLADASGAPLGQLTTNGSRQPPNSLARVYESTWAFYPTWAPTGDRLVVTGQAVPPSGDPPVDANLGLFELSVAGGYQPMLYAAPNVQVGRSLYLPDGQRLLFVRSPNSADGQQQLYLLDLDTGAAEPFAAAPSPSYDPAISPDGRWLAFAAQDGDGTDLFALPLAGGGTPLRLSDIGSARAPAFSPDGRQIAFLAIAPGEGGFDLWVADLIEEAGGLRATTPRRLTNAWHLDADSGLVWGG
ncbi:WD40 domain-containing protein [Oscillochloris trichoides DG-6]|uniref:WD40 domain-containing protein n=1 Tax=Oscillochloris trichoides DG-6 TaxID=765420 RepID=E1IFU9_9CHLR|nr:PD40 domain-containing protein [Oscillochloris trichoides]EFO79942.1 WD40 domain-containing protein [Oscillochloris trichoides DG-6]